VPLTDELEAWLRAQAARLSRKSEMGKAVACIPTRWDGLILFANDAGSRWTATSSKSGRCPEPQECVVRRPR
jgi:Transposase IS66 family